MTTIQLPVEIESQIEALARRTGESRDDLVREAILTYLEDREDARIAAERLKNPGKRISLEEIGRKYGLVD
ncbi:MAG TPA: ribbon-helix-helix protein, CopG family [Edaphobacter sp.]|nr:ribbon-helix-helix protein, CopG family [Edaphobacter sp.]